MCFLVCLFIIIFSSMFPFFTLKERPVSVDDWYNLFEFGRAMDPVWKQHQLLSQD